MKYQYVCSNCGSTHVEARIWVNPNDMQTHPNNSIDTSDAECWCNNCEAHYKLNYVPVHNIPAPLTLDDPDILQR